METAKGNGHEPYAYLWQVLTGVGFVDYLLPLATIPAPMAVAGSRSLDRPDGTPWLSALNL